MSYYDIETSEEGGSAIKLFRFIIGGKTFLFNDSADPWTHAASGDTYEPLTITHTELTSTDEDNKARVKFELAYNDKFVKDLSNWTNDTVNVVNVSSVHLTDTGQNIALLWSGRLIERKRINHRFQLSAEPLTTTLERSALRAKYTRVCRHTLYQMGCNVNKDIYKKTATVTSVTANIIVVNLGNGVANDYYTGGYMQIPGTKSGRHIIAQTGNNVTISAAFNDLKAGQSVDVYPGCDHVRTTCKDKFNNILNYGGLPYIPSKNPFGGSSIV